MKICLAQTRPVKGDIQRNIENHKKLIELAISHGSDLVVFPELSLTGYESRLAEALAMDQHDGRLDVFQRISDGKQVTIGVGAPTKSDGGVCISMFLFQPQKERQTYSKKYIHADEEPFFVSGESFTDFEVNKTRIALAICYELSVPVHAENAFRSGAKIYIASVAKSQSGVERASKRLADIASNYAMTVFMANCIGPSDGFEAAGQSAVWDDKGQLLGQLNDVDEGILMLDTESRESLAKTL